MAAWARIAVTAAAAAALVSACGGDSGPTAEERKRVWLSARDGQGLELLRQALAEVLELRHVSGELRIPPQGARLRARLHDLGAVRAEEHDEHGWRLTVDLAVADAQRLFAQAHGEPLRPLLETVADDTDPA